jgi:uncharacterized membrane protein YfcA
VALLAIPFAAAIGLSLGLLGGGGSVLAVPILVYILGQSVHTATTTSLIVVTIGALAGGIGHARAGRVCWRHATAFTTAALPGVIAGTALGNAIGGRTLIGTFALIMLAAAAGIWHKAGGAARDEEHYGHPSCPPLLVAKDLAAGVLIGTMTGFFGVGGGFLIVPALAILLGLHMRLAVGTSLAIITATSILGLAAHLISGRGLDLRVAGTMTGACIAGALGGAALAGHVPQRQLSRSFAGLVVAVAGYLLVSTTLLGGPPGA